MSCLQAAILERDVASGGSVNLLSLRCSETQTLVRQKVQLLKFQCNEVTITDTGGGNQTHKLSNRQGNMPKMYSWYRKFAN